MTGLIGERLSEIGSETVRWLWPPYLARGKLAVLDGEPGVGKSLLTIDLAARLSCGGELPGGTPGGPPVTTILLSAEDDVQDTIRPRAEAAGADLDRVVFAAGRDGWVPRLPDDLAAVEELIRRHAAGLLVADPVMAFLSAKAAANLDQCVRRALTPLADLADRTGCAILLIRHLIKKLVARAVYRGSGSVGIVGAARTGLLAARHPADPGLRVLSVAKTNLVDGAPSIGYRLRADGAGRSVVEWAGPVPLTADDLGKAPAAALRARDRASHWLLGELAGGPRKAADLIAAAAGAGIPEKTLRRAKSDLRLESHRVWLGDRGEWYWYDPDAAWPKDAPFKKPRELPPLRELGL